VEKMDLVTNHLLIRVSTQRSTSENLMEQMHGDQIGRFFTRWATFNTLGDFSPVGLLFTRLGDFLPFGRLFTRWAIFQPLGDFSPVGRFFNRWEVFSMESFFNYRGVANL
jgi:hypothetical protein